MIRWLRLVVLAAVIIAIIGMGIVIALFLVTNSGFAPVNVHPWIERLIGAQAWEVWVPALWIGWLIAVMAVGGLLLWSMFYVWRRRQYESLLGRLERELVALRNLPIDEPAPFEDLPERPDPRAARAMAATERDGDAGVAEES